MWASRVHPIYCDIFCPAERVRYMICRLTSDISKKDVHHYCSGVHCLLTIDPHSTSICFGKKAFKKITFGGFHPGWFWKTSNIVPINIWHIEHSYCAGIPFGSPVKQINMPQRDFTFLLESYIWSSQLIYIPFYSRITFGVVGNW